MYAQDENKALAQYQRSDEVPYTFAYMGYKQEHYPRGAVAITFKDGIWVTTTPACMETCTLTNKLVRFIVKENIRPGGESLTNSAENDVQYALKQIAKACDFPIYPIEINHIGDLVTHRIGKRIKGKNTNEQNKIIKCVARYLRSYAFKEEIIFKEGTLSLKTDIIDMVISSRILSVKREKDSVLMLKFKENTYVTNIITTPENVSKVIEFLGVFERIKRLNLGIVNPRSIESSIINTVFVHCYSRIALRPAYICKNADGGHRLVHRPILHTERRVSKQEPLVIEAAQILLSIDNLMTR